MVFHVNLLVELTSRLSFSLRFFLFMSSKKSSFNLVVIYFREGEEENSKFNVSCLNLGREWKVMGEREDCMLFS